MKTPIKKLATIMVCLSGLASMPRPARAEELTVYSAIETDDLAKYKTAFEKDHPDITINWVRNSTGIITAKLLAEKASPQADVVWGLAATSLMALKQESMLLPYEAKGINQLDPKFRDQASGAPPQWAGMDAWVAAICFNTAEAAKNKLPEPKSWEDLANPIYQGQIVMPNPASSGTGYLDVSAWIQMFGPEKAWQYMEKLHGNISRYSHSGSKPCQLAASGEAAVGISFAFRGAKLKAKGAPIKIIIPTEGIGWEMEAVGIVKGTKKLAAAKTLMDWAVSRKANEMYSESYMVVAYPGVSQDLKDYPAEAKTRMIDNDFAWAATNRETILAEWQRRFSSKLTL